MIMFIFGLIVGGLLFSLRERFVINIEKREDSDDA